MFNTICKSSARKVFAKTIYSFGLEFLDMIEK